MLITVDSLPGSEMPAPKAAEAEKTAEKILPETENPDDWFSVDLFSEGWDVHHVTAPTVFHRKLYTFSDGKAYINLCRINKLIKNLDDLLLYDLKSCSYRISSERCILVIGAKDSKDVAVLGEYSPRFLVNNNIKEYDFPIRKISDYRVVSLKQFESRLDGGLETHLEAARARLSTMWESRVADINALFE